MKKSSKITIIICVILVFLGIVGYFIVDYILDKDLEEQRQQLQSLIDQYGIVEEENVSTIVAKFNTKVMESSTQYPASDSYSSTENNLYWYSLHEDIYLCIKPFEFTGDREKDIVDMAAIHYTKGSQFENIATELAKSLIKANNSEITDEEVEKLITDAKEVSTEKKGANNGKGISVAFAENETDCEFQVVRLLSQERNIIKNPLYEDFFLYKILTNHNKNNIMLTEVNKRSKNMISKSLEEYLKTMYLLKKQNDKIRVTDIAEKMNCTKASVNKAIYNLKDEGMLNYESYGTIELTEEGENLAKKILEAYDIVYLFLKDVLELNEEDAKSEAEKIKLATTDNTINKLARYVHKELGLSNLNCNYDINQEKCRSCIKRTATKKK